MSRYGGEGLTAPLPPSCVSWPHGRQAYAGTGRVLCHYLNDPVFTAPHDRLADYYLPLHPGA